MHVKFAFFMDAPHNYFFLTDLNVCDSGMRRKIAPFRRHKSRAGDDGQSCPIPENDVKEVNGICVRFYGAINILCEYKMCACGQTRPVALKRVSRTTSRTQRTNGKLIGLLCDHIL